MSAADAQPLPSGQRRTWAVVVAGIVATAALAVLGSVAFRAPWVFGAASTAGQDAAYQALVGSQVAEASRANEAALQRYHASLDNVLATHAPLLDAMTQQASLEATKLATLGRILGWLAYDQVRSTNRTDAYINEQIGQKIVDPVLQALTNDVVQQMDRLQNDLDKNTVQLAVDLAVPAPSIPYMTQRTKVVTEFQQVLRQPAEDVGRGAGPALAFSVMDAAAIPRIASRLFTKQVARIALSGVVSQMDGPFPLGDVIAVLMVTWTSWEIYQLTDQFKDEVRMSLKTSLDESRQALSTRAKAFGANKAAEAVRLQSNVAHVTSTLSYRKETP